MPPVLRNERLTEPAGLEPPPPTLLRTDEAPDAPLVAVTADRGSGKTALLTQWYERAQAARGSSVMWLEIGEDHEPSLLKAELEEMFGADSAPRMLFVDNFHRLRDDAVRAMLIGLAIRAQRPVRVVLAGRRYPLLNLARLRADGLVVELGSDDLELSPSEIDDLVAAGQVDFPTDLRSRIGELTEGWAEGVVNILERIGEYRSHPPADVVELAAVECARSLAGEIESAVEPAHFDLLVKSSILDTVSPAVVHSLAGVEQALDLRQLVQRTPFIATRGRNGDRVRIHGLARLGLFLRLTELEDAPEIAARHCAAGDLLNQAGLLDEAIEQFLLGGDSSRAADVLAAKWAIRPGEVPHAEVERLNGAGAVDYVPHIVTAGLVHARAGEHAEVREVLKRLEGAEWTGPLPNGFASLDTAVVELTGRLPDLTVAEMERFVDVVVRDEVGSGGPRELMGRYSASHHCYWLGRFDEAQRRLDSVLRGHLSVGRETFPDQVVSVLACDLLAIIQHDLGDVDAARRRLAYGDQLADDYGIAGFGVAAQSASQVRRLARAVVGDVADDERTAELQELIEHGVSLNLQVHGAIELVKLLDGKQDFEAAVAALDRIDDFVADRELAPLHADRMERLHRSLRPVRRGQGPAMRITAGERAVLYHLADSSLSQSDISRELGLSINTVKSHLRSIYEKFGVAGRNPTIEHAATEGLLVTVLPWGPPL